MVNTRDRPDPLKVFLGNLEPEINKPKIVELLGFLNLAPVEIIVPQNKGGKLAIAFLVFSTPEEASWAINCLQGLQGPQSPGGIHVHGGGAQHGSLYQLCC